MQHHGWMNDTMIEVSELKRDTYSSKERFTMVDRTSLIGSLGIGNASQQTAALFHSRWNL
jgi:hypothetical protein